MMEKREIVPHACYRLGRDGLPVQVSGIAGRRVTYSVLYEEAADKTMSLGRFAAKAVTRIDPQTWAPIAAPIAEGGTTDALPGS